MPVLSSELRNSLERVVIDARDAAEAGARAALQALAVHHREPYAHMKPAQRALRNHLRARARQVGDGKLSKPDGGGTDHEIDHLVGECAYEHWHRMLFARFLAETGLLIEPQEGMAVSLAEAAELTKEDGVDVWVFASRCAQRMLPQIFRPDDPLLQVTFATEHMVMLEKLLTSLPQAVFTASDALGWVYQFWQSKKKDDVNRSEVKIGADEIAAVTQLFTEPYMVEFLLHNTLGAWWAGKKLAAKDAESGTTEEELRKKLALPGVTWEYLRFIPGAGGESCPWRPAAGTFEGWPKTAAELKVLDPCCGSGHFLVSALHHMVPIRMAEECISLRNAVDAVLRDNLYGLEIDDRCCQIAAFALAFAAWTYQGAGGYRPLPDLHIACTGIGPRSTEEQWIRIAEKSGIPVPTGQHESVRNGLLRLHRLFSQAPVLGSLVNPVGLLADLVTADYITTQPYLATIMSAEKTEDETRERAIAAAGMARAAALLVGRYTLVVTNVPYLGQRDQGDAIRDFAAEEYRDSKADLATMFVERSLQMLAPGGTVAAVTTENWLFLKRYERLRRKLLTQQTWDMVVRLGEHAFESAAAAGAFAAMTVISLEIPSTGWVLSGIDASAPRGTPPIRACDKPALLRGAVPRKSDRGVVQTIAQKTQLSNPDAAISFNPPTAHRPLSDYAYCFQGASTIDIARFRLCFWETLARDGWNLHLSTPDRASLFSGYSYVSASRDSSGEMSATAQLMKEEGFLGGWLSGNKAWGKTGVACSWMNDLPATPYHGAVYDNMVAVIIPSDARWLPAIWAYCSSSDFNRAVRRINQKVQVANSTLVKVPFDLAHWQHVAAEKYPNGLPEPESDDPTQWLFHGRPDESTAALQVAVARLLGYRWPAELDDKIRVSLRARALVARCDELTKFADEDGIVCIPSVRGEEPAAKRLEALLAGTGVNPAKARELAGGVDVDQWLRNRFFEEHCRLFHDRPFVWHIWDGRERDGFHALLNCHKLCEGGGKGRKLLESLTYSYLGEWIARQKDEARRGEGGAEDRLAAAVELQSRLQSILKGEPPFDLFLRWKPLAEQPIGWEPDVNDGVRMNVRPFLASDLPNGRTGAGVLRWKPNLKWTKDRGKEPKRPKAEYPWFWSWDESSVDFMGTGEEPDGNRHNDCHYTNRTKQSARGAAKKGKR